MVVSRSISSADRKKAIIIYMGASATEAKNPNAYYDFHWLATIRCEELMASAEKDLAREGKCAEYYYFSWYRVRNVCEAVQKEMAKVIHDRCVNESVVSISQSAVEFILTEFARAFDAAFMTEWDKLQERLNDRGIR